ncbi:type ISP restriction/modification enzyme [Nostoc sphaeroides]|uniref:DNA methyltransferase n=1 Tax=Nostoc sphaeroides CCNUC1 TaxID=2653204 RepID=A0A5P8WAK8_9NOSO|nr:type ISP restriction/modification enzyme [Nostoc sphaeroides]QFS49206.1 DNA methyltransferase [Nostoc sphaeroides CCNUC1]
MYRVIAYAANGTIILDDVTTLEGVPKIAWEYRLGNRCALEWILDQYKEKNLKTRQLLKNSIHIALQITKNR